MTSSVPYSASFFSDVELSGKVVSLISMGLIS